MIARVFIAIFPPLKGRRRHAADADEHNRGILPQLRYFVAWTAMLRFNASAQGSTKTPSRFRA
jgi:hypothetical protein